MDFEAALRHNLAIVETFNPSSVFNIFAHLSCYPRVSKHEEPAMGYIIKWANEHDFTHKRDQAGNMAVFVPATTGKEGVLPTILHGHVDMVGEKDDDAVHNFQTDPIVFEVDDEYLTARGTTLGGDDGIGVALAMSIAEDPNLEHGPLILLFTVCEEIRLTGAREMDPVALGLNDLPPETNLLSLDGEGVGKFYLGCAGGQLLTVDLPLEARSVFPDTVAVKLSVEGLEGGHSGIDIHRYRGSPIIIGMNILRQALSEFDLWITYLKGGAGKYNAIPRRFDAIVQMDPTDVERFKSIAAEAKSLFGNAIKGKGRQELSIKVAEPDTEHSWILDLDTRKILNFLLGLPVGPQGFDFADNGQIDTSVNIGVLEITETGIQVKVSIRSSLNASLHEVTARAASVAELAGAEIDYGAITNAWTPDVNSPLIKLIKDFYPTVSGGQAANIILGVHGGVEAGIFGDKLKINNLVVFGATLISVHSPDEKLHIGSVEKAHNLTRALVEKFAQ